MMGRNRARSIAGKLLVTAVFLAFFAIAAASLVGAHDPGFVYVLLIEAATCCLPRWRFCSGWSRCSCAGCNRWRSEGRGFGSEALGLAR